MIIVRRVAGGSMLPTLKNGQLVIGLKTSKPYEGQVVIARLAERDVIKRVIEYGNKLKLAGDNSLATEIYDLEDTWGVYKLIFPFRLSG